MKQPTNDSSFDSLFYFFESASYIIIFIVMFSALMQIFIVSSHTSVIVDDLNEIKSELNEIHEIIETNAVCPS
jgi:hypothetical protein